MIIYTGRNGIMYTDTNDSATLKRRHIIKIASIISLHALVVAGVAVGMKYTAGAQSNDTPSRPAQTTPIYMVAPVSPR